MTSNLLRFATMARILIAAASCLGVASTPALAAGPQDVDAVMRHYDADAVAQGRIEVQWSGDVAWVRGTSRGGPWLDVWQRSTGDWKLVAEVQVEEIAPIRFGAKKRQKPCGGSS
jgi:hypothetical protein